MQLYFAPMEGITTYTFRNAHYEMFGGCDTYFAPFIVPTDNEKITLRTLKDIKPEHNSAPIVPQVLCNSADAFFKFVKKAKTIGFEEININFGCPSGTVIRKGRGSGALKNLEELDNLLNNIFAEADIKISIKTRTGFYSHDEFEAIMQIYNKYPIAELIIHPRVREEYYKGRPNIECFKKAYDNTDLKLCYNGDVYSKEDFERIHNDFPEINSVMIGRGAIKNPAIFREIHGGTGLKTEELIAFSKLLEQRYFALYNFDRYTLHKLKEIWIYAMQNFPEEKKIAKAIKKSACLKDLNAAIECLPELKRDC